MGQGLGKFDFEGGSLDTMASSNDMSASSVLVPAATHSSKWDLAVQRELDTVTQDLRSKGPIASPRPIGSRTHSLYVAPSAPWLFAHEEKGSSRAQSKEMLCSTPMRNYLKRSVSYQSHHYEFGQYPYPISTLEGRARVDSDEKHPNLRVSCWLAFLDCFTALNSSGSSSWPIPKISQQSRKARNNTYIHQRPGWAHLHIHID